jgi:2,3-bisphosphoglycerate-dependent phosphoglycerate mutase
MKRTPVVIILLFLSGIFIQCKKETVTEYRTITDTLLITVHDTVTIPTLISDTITTFIIMRHAERDNVGSDPSLNADGIIRADELKRILANVPVASVYSTPFNRTRETVTPLANDKGLLVTEYSTGTPYLQLVNQVMNDHKGKVIMMAGHSNTVPEILKALTDNAFNIQITESQYDNLFIVSLPAGLTPKVFHMKYGKATP